MITITGATGKTGSPVADILLEKGEQVRVIGRSAERLEKFRMQGAEIAVGDQADGVFLTNALTGSDTLYLLIPPKPDADNVRAYYNELGGVAVQAIRKAGVKKIVFLSSLGAEKPSGTGPVLGLHDVEAMLSLLREIDIVVLRPGYFMENTLGNLEMIASKSINGGPMPADTRVAMVATADIAEKAASLLLKRTFRGHSIEEIVGDRITSAEMTAIMGTALGINHLPYLQFSDHDAEAGLLAMGLSASVAHAYVELAHGVTEGLIDTTLLGHDELSAPTRFERFVEQVYKPAFLAMGHPVTA